MPSQTGYTVIEDQFKENASGVTAAPGPPSQNNDLIEESIVTESQAPDGGYGWVIIFTCAVITFWFMGTTYCWGLFQAALIQEHVASASTLASVGSLTTSCVSFLAVFNAKVIQKIGVRKYVLLGVSLFALGEALAGFTTTNIVGLFITIGVVQGIRTGKHLSSLFKRTD
jgi:hypothetical protein